MTGSLLWPSSEASRPAEPAPSEGLTPFDQMHVFALDGTARGIVSRVEQDIGGAEGGQAVAVRGIGEGGGDAIGDLSGAVAVRVEVVVAGAEGAAGGVEPVQGVVAESTVAVQGRSGSGSCRWRRSCK